MREIKIKVLSCTDRKTMFLFFKTIYTTNSYLSNTSDEHLTAAVQHELGHQAYFKIMLSMIFITVCVSLSLALLPLNKIIVYLIYLLFIYPLLCWLLRLGELNADRYAFQQTKCYTGFLELLNDESLRLDTKLADAFYLLRWHPSKERRIKNIKIFLNRYIQNR